MFPLANTPVHAESLLYSLGKAAGGIGLNVIADKTVRVLYIYIFSDPYMES